LDWVRGGPLYCGPPPPPPPGVNLRASTNDAEVRTQYMSHLGRAHFRCRQFRSFRWLHCRVAPHCVQTEPLEVYLERNSSVSFFIAAPPLLDKAIKLSYQHCNRCCAPNLCGGGGLSCFCISFFSRGPVAYPLLFYLLCHFKELLNRLDFHILENFFFLKFHSCQYQRTF
jgi:hypothetical protein